MKIEKIGDQIIIKLSGNDLRRLERGLKLTLENVEIQVDHSIGDEEYRTNQPNPYHQSGW